MRRSVVLASLLFVTTVVAEDKSAALPAKWHGTWAGKMTLTGAGDKANEVALTLKIDPIKDTRDITWVLTYGDGEKAVVKDYKLVPHGDKAGRFRIDERNGVELDARLVGGVLYSHFEVGGSWLTARYELREDVLRVEVTSAKPAAEKTGKGKVQGYTVEAVQAAELRRR